MVNGYGFGINGYWIFGIIILVLVVFGIIRFLIARKRKRFDAGSNAKK